MQVKTKLRQKKSITIEGGQALVKDLTVYRENINSFWIRIRKELLFDPVQSMQRVSARVNFSETPSQVIYTQGC